MYYIKMEQEGGDKSDKIYITEVKTGSLTQKTTTLIFSYEKENKSSKKKDGYNYDFVSKDDKNQHKFYFKDENIMTLFKMLFERVLKYKIKLEKGKIRIPLDKIDKQQMNLETVYIEVSNFGTKEKKISSILKKNDNDNNYVNLKDDEFISYLTKSGLDKNAVKLIIAIYVTYNIKSSGQSPIKTNQPPIETNQPPIETNVEDRDYSSKAEEPSNPRNPRNFSIPGYNDSNNNDSNNNDEFYNNNDTFTINLVNYNHKDLWKNLKKTISNNSKYIENGNKVTIKKDEFTQDDFDKFKNSKILSKGDAS